jgi:RNase P/RNase MRP subunit POP5
MNLTSLGQKQTAQIQPLLLRTEIKFERSVIHATVQHAAREINAALGVTNEALLDQFTQTDAGKKWLAGFREYAIFALGKTV